MTALPLAAQAALAVLAVAAAVFDMRTRRIPNWLTLSALPVGIALSVLTRGVHGLISALAGAGLAFAIYLSLFALRAMGGGDVKLMTAVGALTGPSNWLVIFVLTALAGGVLALAVLTVRGGLKSAIANVVFVLGEFIQLRAPYRARPEFDIDHPGAARLPHGVSIAFGVLLYLIVVRAT